MIKDTFLRLPPEKKAQIIQKSHHVFASAGFDGVTVKDIVNACDIPRGSFYQYFDGTIDIFRVCLEDIAEKKIYYMKSLMDLIGLKPFIEVYRLMIERGIDFALDHPTESSSALILYNSVDVELLKIKNDFEQQGITWIVSLIEADQSAGFMSSFIDKQILARVLYHFNAYDLMVKFKDGKNKESLMNYADGFLNIIENGIR